MKKLNAWEERATIDGKEYTITIIERDTDFESYISTEHYPMMYMYGMPKDQTQAKDPMVLTLSDAIEIAIANAPDYLDIFDEE